MVAYEFIDPEEQLSSKDFQFVEHFLKSTGRTQLGWHYITDITWIYSKVKDWPRDLKILDAGGGGGPLQFFLAEMGFHVTNIDMALAEPSSAYIQRYGTTLVTLPSFVPTSYMDLLSPISSESFMTKAKNMVKKTSAYKSWKSEKYNLAHEKWRSSANISNTPLGSIQWTTGSLCNMPEIPLDNFDAVVSLSAWEHIPFDMLDDAIAEIRRVLKPDARWAVTTSATEKSSTWWHEPSQSNCFATSDMEGCFGAKSIGNQNPELILDKYRNCTYLKENLAEFYKKSGKYGMPWGIWDPKYIPIGLSQ